MPFQLLKKNYVYSFIVHNHQCVKLNALELEVGDQSPKFIVSPSSAQPIMRGRQVPKCNYLSCGFNVQIGME